MGWGGVILLLFGVGTVSSDGQLELGQAAVRTPIRAGCELEKLFLLFVRELVEHLPKFPLLILFFVLNCEKNKYLFAFRKYDAT